MYVLLSGETYVQFSQTCNLQHVSFTTAVKSNMCGLMCSNFLYFSSITLSIWMHVCLWCNYDPR